MVNRYGRVVSREGNRVAQELIDKVFEVTDRQWRGIGLIPGSGLALREVFDRFDAEKKFNVSHISATESPLCMSGSILQGTLKPDGCPAFARECTPEHPLGATMVSSEGACAAYYNYHRNFAL